MERKKLDDSSSDFLSVMRNEKFRQGVERPTLGSRPILWEPSAAIEIQLWGHDPPVREAKDFSTKEMGVKRPSLRVTTHLWEPMAWGEIQFLNSFLFFFRSTLGGHDPPVREPQVFSFMVRKPGGGPNDPLGGSRPTLWEPTGSIAIQFGDCLICVPFRC